MESAANVDRLQAIVKGEVQGVGFRYTSRKLAMAYPKLTGIVRNLVDGSVELTIEGYSADIHSFLADLKSEYRDNIADIREKWSFGPRSFSAFSIGF